MLACKIFKGLAVLLQIHMDVYFYPFSHGHKNIGKKIQKIDCLFMTKYNAKATVYSASGKDKNKKE